MPRLSLLVLGGTRFVGRALVAEALTRGHGVTLVHRGRSGADLFPEAEHVHLDRNEGFAPLQGRAFDAVLDVSAYFPHQVRLALEQIEARRWLLVSTISVYRDFPPGLTEDGGLLPALDGAELTNDTYGGLKVACEELVRAAHPDAVIVRPGIVAGAHDVSNRLPYWVRRLDEGGPVLVPARLEQPVQLVDARDLATLALDRLEAGDTGPFNAAGAAVTLRELFATIRADADLRPVSPEAHGLEPGVELPLTLPEDGSRDGLFRVSSGRAEGTGWTRRPLKDTVAEVRQWLAEGGQAPNAKYSTLTPEREREILSAAKPLSE